MGAHRIRPGSLMVARDFFKAIAAGIVILCAAPAHAEPGDTQTTQGSATATLADPLSLQKIADLRFGRFAAPKTASTIRIASDGTITPTGDVVSSMGMAQPPDGRGPAQFRVDMDGNRGFIAFFPRRITISNGTSSMLVNDIGGRIVRIRGGGRDSVYSLDMGGTLNIEANQAAGQYAGDFDITVLYL